MSKFMVGDKVRVKCDVKVGGCVFHKMLKYAGQVGNITESEQGDYRIDSTGYLWWTKDAIEHHVTPREFIVIRRSGAETIAELRHDREVIKSAKATCASSDTFDFSAGAKLAFDRLMGREEHKRESLADVFAKLEQPAHRFKVGDRVVTPNGNGTIIFIDTKLDEGVLLSYLIRGDEKWVGAAWINCVDDEAITSGDGCRWFNSKYLSPAPEPPKFYTGKVFAAKIIPRVGYDLDDGTLRNRIGRIFEFKNGMYQGDHNRYGFGSSRIKSFSDLCSSLWATEWHKVKEPSDV